MALNAMARLRAPPSPAATSSPTGTGPLPNAACGRARASAEELVWVAYGLHETQPDSTCRQDQMSGSI